MKKKIVAWLIVVGVLLCGCGNMAGGESSRNMEGSTIEGELTRGQSVNTKDSSIVQQGGTDGDTIQNNKDEDSGHVPDEATDTRAVQGGPYGEISVTLPEGWGYEACPMDSDELMSGMYGIRFHPEGVEEGYVELAYMDFFGVCGTGLSLEHTQLAGQPVSIGTYDNHSYWDYVSFGEEYEGIVALTYWVEDWWSEYGGQALEILDTLSFARDVREGGASIASEESDIDSIALHVSLKDITPAGATFVFIQYDTKASKGELIYGDDYVIERREGDRWESVPVVVEGDYGFHDIAYTLTPDAPDEQGYVTGRATAEAVIDWEWLYGKLSPGEYRIGKSVLDFVESGNFDKYMVYAHFFLTEGFKLTVTPAEERKAVKIIENSNVQAEGEDYALYYYGLEEVLVTIGQQTMPFVDALTEGAITLDEIVAKSNRDVETGIIVDIFYRDGGSRIYRYDDYTIIKYNRADGSNRDLYIGSADMDYSVTELSGR